MRPAGFALISALFVAGLVAGVAGLLVTRQQYLVAAASAIKDSLRAERAIDALEVAAARQLLPPAGAPPGTQVVAPDPRKTLQVSLDGLTASGSLEALDGRFNLNSLSLGMGAGPRAGTLEEGGGEEGAGGVAAQALRAVAEAAGVRLEAGLQRGGARNPQLLSQQVAAARFVLLLQALDLDPGIVPAVLDWLDPDTEARAPNGAEDDYYSRLDPPYRAANRGFADVSELLRVRGVTPAMLQRLRPYVTVREQPAPIDLNAAPIEVLRAVAPGLDRATAEALARARTAKPWQSLAEFLALPALQTRPVLAQGLAVQSSRFTLNASVDTPDLPTRFRSTLQRTSARSIDCVQRERVYAGE